MQIRINELADLLPSHANIINEAKEGHLDIQHIKQKIALLKQDKKKYIVAKNSGPNQHQHPHRPIITPSRTHNLPMTNFFPRPRTQLNSFPTGMLTFGVTLFK